MNTVDYQKKFRIFVFSCILFFVSSLFFYYINSNIREFHDWPSLKYTAGDSATYLNVGEWLIGDKDFSEVKHGVAIRPFLYPLLVALLEKIHPWGILVFQFILWETQLLIVYYCGILINNSLIAAGSASLCCATILSPIGISLHVLSETTASFLITSSLFFTILYTKKNKYYYILFCLMSLSLCSLTRPTYFYVFLLISLLFIAKKRNVSMLLFFLIVSIPIIFQFSIMRKNFSINRLSVIDTVTINDYLLSLLDATRQEGHEVAIREVRELRRRKLADTIKKHGYPAADSTVFNEVTHEIKSHPGYFVKNFIMLIRDNSTQPSSFLQSNSYSISKIFYDISTIQSKIVLWLNILSLLLFLLSSIKLACFRQEHLVGILAIFLISLSYISTGVTFWQGDRFIIPVYFISIIFFYHQLTVFCNLFAKQKNNDQ